MVMVMFYVGGTVNSKFEALFWREESWNIKFDALFWREESKYAHVRTGTYPSL